MKVIKSFVLAQCIALVVGVSLSEVSGKECIDQLTDLELSLLNDQGNIENLTKAFIPPNQPSPIVVRACYYAKPANHTPNGDCENATYIFRWSTSPIFLYAQANLLKVLTLGLVQITEQTAILTIDAPVCDILLLNYLTTLLRSYMSSRSNEGIDGSLVGRVAFYNASEDDFLLLVGDTDLGQTPLLLTISGIPLVLCAAFGVPIAIYIAYDIGKLSKLQSSVNYFIGGFVLFLCFAVPVVIGIDIENLRSVSNIIQSEWIKYITVLGISGVTVYGFIAGFIIAYLKRKVWMISNNTTVSVIIQTFGIGLIVGFSGLLVFHGLFIVFFLLLTTSPQHITVSVVFYGAGCFSFVIITALLLVLLVDRYNCYLAISTNKNANKSQSTSTKWRKCYICLTTSYLVFFFILVYFFLAAFIYCFSQFVSFSTSGDSDSYIATLTPSLLLTVLGVILSFVLKNQTSLHKHITGEDTNDNVNDNSISDGTSCKTQLNKSHDTAIEMNQIPTS